MNVRFGVRRFAATLFGGVLVASGLALGTGQMASADVPDPVFTEFTAPECAGTTMFEPTDNAGFAVPDTTLVFAERLRSFNAGHIVPLYDAYGGSILVNADGTINGLGPDDDDYAAYPPLCGTRYVAGAEGGAGVPVSEWMFCTDRESLTCGDTDGEGYLVDKLGQRINPMTGLDKNPRLSSDQEKLIAYLVQHGHTYSGVGSQSWGDVETARSDATTNERVALQTLVWCISDPAATNVDFLATCEANLPAIEQDRLLALIPDAPEVSLSLNGTAVELGTPARFTVTTNLYHQPIELVTGGTAAATWSVCEGDAVLSGTTLTVAGSDPAVSADVVLCAVVTSLGTVTLDASATPPSTQHIGWSQSTDNPDSEACQVYATFHLVDQVRVDAAASVTFVAPAEPSEPTEPEDALAASGGERVSGSLIGALLGIMGVGALLVLRTRRTAVDL